MDLKAYAQELLKENGGSGSYGRRRAQQMSQEYKKALLSTGSGDTAPRAAASAAQPSGSVTEAYKKYLLGLKDEDEEEKRRRELYRQQVLYGADAAQALQGTTLGGRSTDTETALLGTGRGAAGFAAGAADKWNFGQAAQTELYVNGQDHGRYTDEEIQAFQNTDADKGELAYTNIGLPTALIMDKATKGKSEEEKQQIARERIEELTSRTQWNTEREKAWQEYLASRDEGERRLGSVAQQIGRQLPSMAVSMAAGHALGALGAATGGAAGAATGVSIGQNIGLGAMGYSAAGSAAQEAWQKAKEEGREISVRDAYEVGVRKGMVEVMSEKMFGGIAAYGEGVVSTALGNTISDFVNSPAGERVLRYGAQFLNSKAGKAAGAVADILGENIEEAVSDFFSTRIENDVLGTKEHELTAWEALKGQLPFVTEEGTMTLITSLILGSANMMKTIQEGGSISKAEIKQAVDAKVKEIKEKWGGKQAEKPAGLPSTTPDTAGQQNAPAAAGEAAAGAGDERQKYSSMPNRTNVAYDDIAQRNHIQSETHNRMVESGNVVDLTEIYEANEEFFPNLRDKPRKERGPVLTELKRELKRLLKDYLKGLRDVSYQFDTNGDILEAKLSGTGINEAFSGFKRERASMLGATDQIFRSAEYMYSTGNEHGTARTAGWDYYYVPIQIGEEISGVRIAVRNIADPDNHLFENQIYNWDIKTNETESLAPEGESSSAFALNRSSDSDSDNTVPQDERTVNTLRQELEERQAAFREATERNDPDYDYPGEIQRMNALERQIREREQPAGLPSTRAEAETGETPNGLPSAAQAAQEREDRRQEYLRQEAERERQRAAEARERESARLTEELGKAAAKAAEPGPHTYRFEGPNGNSYAIRTNTYQNGTVMMSVRENGFGGRTLVGGEYADAATAMEAAREAIEGSTTRSRDNRPGRETDPVDESLERPAESLAQATERARAEGYPQIEDAEGVKHQAVPGYTWVKAKDRGNYGRVVGKNADGSLQVQFINKEEGTSRTVSFGPAAVEWVQGEYSTAEDVPAYGDEPSMTDAEAAAERDAAIEEALAEETEANRRRIAERTRETSMEIIPEEERRFNPEGKSREELLNDIINTAESYDGRYLYFGHFTEKLLNFLKEKGFDVKDLPVLMNYRDAYLSMENKENGRYQGLGINYHDLGVDGMSEAMDKLGTPTDVMRSKKPGKVELVLAFDDKKGRPVLAIVELNTAAIHDRGYIEAHVVSSIYGKRAIDNYMKKAADEGRLLTNKREAPSTVIPQVQYEGDNNENASLNDNIPHAEEESKPENRTREDMGLPPTREATSRENIADAAGEQISEEMRSRAEAMDESALRKKIRDTENEIKALEKLGRRAGLTEAQQTELKRLRGNLEMYREVQQQKKGGTTQQKKEPGKAEPKTARREAVKNILERFSIQAANNQEARTAIDSALQRIQERGKVTEQDRKALFDKLIDLGIVKQEANETFRGIRWDLKGRAVYVPQNVRHDFGDNWAEYQKLAHSAGFYLTSNQNDARIDAVTMELADSYGEGLFPTDVSTTEMLENMIEAADKGKPHWVSLQDSLAQMAAEGRIDIDDVLGDEMDWLDSELRAFARSAGMEMELRGRRAESELKAETLKKVKQLQNAAKKAGPEWRAKINDLVGDIDTMSRRISAAGLENLQALAEQYKRMRTAAGYVDADNPGNWTGRAWMEERLARLEKLHIDDLSLEQVAELQETVSAMLTQMQNERQLVEEGHRRMIADAAESMNDEIQAARGVGKGRLAAAVERWFSQEQLGGRRFLMHLVGYHNGEMARQVEALENGGTRKLDYQMRAIGMFQPFIQKYADWIKTASGKAAQGIEYDVPGVIEFNEDGTAARIETKHITITPSMRVALLMHSKNMDNLHHIEQGGIRVPDWNLYKKGRIEEAYKAGEIIKMQPDTVRTIVKDCTAEERAFAELLSKYGDGMAKDAINEVSLQLDGFERAGVGNYWALESDQAFTKKDVGREAVAGTVEGIGSIANERVKGAGNPVRLYDAMDTLLRNIDNVGSYYGYAIPVHNFNEIYNHTFHEKGKSFSGSIKESLNKKWGEGTTGYIEKLIADVQNRNGGTNDTLGRLMAKVRSGAAGATLTANPSVALSQFASYPGAAQTLGWDALGHGLFGKVDMDLVAKYTPVLWSRRNSDMNVLQGEGEVSLAKKAPAVFDWISAIDEFTIKRLWSAAEYAVTRDTKMTKDDGDAYYQQVAEMFNRAVYDTQPNYTPFQRSQILRSDNQLVKSLTMFKTVGQQYYGMMFEAAGRLRAAQAEYKANASTESRQQLQEAQKYAARTYSGLIVGNLMFAALKGLASVLKKKDDKYRDEEGQLTTRSFAKGVFDLTAETFAGSAMFGDQLYTLIESKMRGEKWYGPEVSSVSWFTENAESLSKVISTGVSVLQGDASYQEGLGAIHDMAEGIAQFFGFPAGNMEDWLLAGTKWIAPEWAQKYESLFKDYDKGSLKKLRSGKDLEAGVRTLCDVRGMEAGDKTVSELSRLYAAGYTAAVPTAIPAKITWTVNGEQQEVQLGRAARKEYQNAWNDVVDVDALVNSAGYRKATDKQKAQMLARLYELGTETARAAAADEYAPDKWVTDFRTAEHSGITAPDYLDWYYGTKDIQADKDADGSPVSGTAKIKKLQYIDGMDLGKKQKDALYKLAGYGADEIGDAPWNCKYKGDDWLLWYGLSDSSREAYETTLRGTGMKLSTYVDAYDKYWNTSADKDANGNSISGSKKAKIVEYINGLGISDEQKQALYSVWYKGTGPWGSGGLPSTRSTGSRVLDYAREHYGLPSTQGSTARSGGNSLPSTQSSGSRVLDYAREHFGLPSTR